MENFDQPLDVGTPNVPEDDLLITEEITMYWKQTAKWTMFISILMFIGFGLLVCLFLFSVIFARAGGNASMAVSGLFSLGMLTVLMLLPGLFLYRFSTMVKAAFAAGDTKQLTEGFTNMRSYYKLTGVTQAIFFGIFLLYLLIFLAIRFG